MLELQPKGSTYPLCEGYYLGQPVKYLGDHKRGIKPFETEIVGIDLTTFATINPLVMVRYKFGQCKVTESKFAEENSGLQIVYYKDVKFLWANLNEIEVVDDGE